MFPVRVGEHHVLHVDISNVGIESEAVLLGTVNPRLSPQDAADPTGGRHGALEVGGEQEGPADDVGAADDGIRDSGGQQSDLGEKKEGTNLKTSA